MAEAVPVTNSTMPATFEEMVDTVLAEMRVVMLDRHAKYGRNNIGRNGLRGVSARIGDKLSRLENYCEGNGVDSADESLADTLLDLGNYGLIGYCVMKGWWSSEVCPPLTSRK